MSSLLIVGPGRLGGYVAFRALQLGVVETVFLAGRTEPRTFGIARDLQEAFPDQEIVPLKSYTVPNSVDYTFLTFSTLKWSPSIGVNDRWIEGQSNMAIVDQLANACHLSDLGEIFVVSNPVDIITQYIAEVIAT